MRVLFLGYAAIDSRAGNPVRVLLCFIVERERESSRLCMVELNLQFRDVDRAVRTININVRRRNIFSLYVIARICLQNN